MKNIALPTDQSNSTQALKGGRSKSISFPLRVITWLVIAAQINAAVPLLAEVMVAGAINATEAASKTVAVNTKQEKLVPAPPLWSGEIEQQIGDTRLFAEPLLPVGKTVNNDNQALLAALLSFSNRTNRDDFSSLEKYLAAHPKSPWRPSLLTSFGMFLKDEGYFTRALQNWRDAWNMTSQFKSGSAKLMADRAGAEYVRLAAAVGQADALEAMLNGFQDRVFDSSVHQMVEAARSSLALMRKQPTLMYTCGPRALSRIRDAEGKNVFPPEIMDCRTSNNGFSLYELMHLANRIQMDYQMVKRAPGAKVILPAVVHLKVGHYVAVVKEYQGRYLIQDPTSGNEDMWITKAALDDEASGYCLVRNGALPAGWQSVTEADGLKVFGRGAVDGVDLRQLKNTSLKSGGGCPPDKGMPFYSFHTMAVSLNVQDTPLGYSPAYGPEVNFTLTYNQRDTTQPTLTIRYPNVGRNWTFDWFSYIEDNVDAPAATVTRYLPGGGQETYIFDTQTSTFISDYDTRAKLVRTGSGVSATYAVDFADGSKMFYTKSDGDTTGGRKVFLTQVQDPQGNHIDFVWTGTLNPRLTEVRDALYPAAGSTTKIAYASENSSLDAYYRIATVTDHFGTAQPRTAYLEYSSDGRLVKITDVIGMVSTFNYDTTVNPGFMLGMTTPYGTTAFATGGTTPNAWLEATDPLGQKERLEFNQSTTLPGIGISENEALVPKVAGVLPPFQNVNLYYRNSFFWSKKVMQEMGGVITPESYVKADIYHWCHSLISGLASGTLESLKRPLENRIWFRYPGQGPNAVDAWTEGTSTQPAYVARVLDDGTTQLTRFDYNDFGRLTAVTNPVGKITRFVYANGIDLMEVRQDNPTSLTPDASGGDLLASFTYDTTYNRLVKTATDASGQVTTFNYGSYGQISSVVDAKSKTTSFAYNYPSHPGFLHTITGPTTISGAVTTFIPDAYDRVQSVTGPDNYTVSFTYDALDRATQVTYPDNTTEQVKYRFLDPILSKDRQNRWTGFEYDAQRHLTATKDSLGRVTQYNWCACGDLESIIDANTNITTWVRDLQGRVTQKIYPDASIATYTYESTTSRLKDVTDAMGQTTHYDYYIDDTLKKVSYLNATFATPAVSFTYDTKYSRIKTMVDGVGTTTYNYNPITTTPTLGAGRLGSVVSTFPSATVSYTYDELGRITTRSIGSVQTTWGFDDLGRLSTVADGLGSFSYSYHAFVGATPTATVMDTLTYPNGQTVEVTSFGNSDTQNHGRLKTIHNKLSTTTISKFDYAYDVVGRIASWTRQFDSATPTFYKFQYDLVDQLLGAALTNGIPASPGTLVKQYLYSFDNLGNRATESVDTPIAASTAAFNNLNQLTKRTPGQRIPFSGTLSPAPRDVTINGFPATMPTTTSFQGIAAASVDNPTVTVVATDGGGNKNIKKYKLETQQVSAAGDPTMLAYDLNGNLVFSATGNAEDTYDWDAANRMIATEHHVSGAMVRRSEFAYDGMGRRVKLVEKNSSGTVTSTKTFLWCGLELCQERDAAGSTVARQYFAMGEKRGATKYFYTRDHLGSIREVTDNSGVTQARYDYDPYGTRTPLYGSFVCDFGFTGHYLHGQSGLYLTLFRSYDAVTGRWLSRDPIAEAGGLNLYAYVENEPVSKIDPLGLNSLTGMDGYGNKVWSGPLSTMPQSFRDAGYRPYNTYGAMQGADGKWIPFPEEDLVGLQPSFLGDMLIGGVAGFMRQPVFYPRPMSTMGKGIVCNGRVVAHQPIESVLSHELLAARSGTLVTAPAAGTRGALVQGAQAFTYQAEGAYLKYISGSMNFNSTVNNATINAVTKFIQGQ